MKCGFPQNKRYYPNNENNFLGLAYGTDVLRSHRMHNGVVSKNYINKKTSCNSFIHVTW